MTGFWVIGIGINVVFAGAVIWWAVRNWRSSGTGRGTTRDDHPDRR